MLISEKSLRRLIREELMRETLREKGVLEEGSFKELLKSAALAAGVGLGSLFGGGVDAGAFAKPTETVGVAASSDMSRSGGSVGVATIEEKIAFSTLYNKVIDRLSADGVDVRNRQLLTYISSEIFIHHQDEQKLYDFLKICFSVLEKSGYEAFMQNIETVRELGQKIIKKHKSGSAKSIDGEHEVWMGTVRKKGEKMPSRWNQKR